VVGVKKIDFPDENKRSDGGFGGEGSKQMKDLSDG